MHPAFWRICPSLTISAWLLFFAWIGQAASEDVLVITQDYNIVEQGKDGPQAKDIRQIIYIKRDIVCIDELGGDQGSEKVTESIMLDLRRNLIINLNHQDKKKITDTFDERRRRIEEKKKQVRSDIEAMDKGKQRERVEKLWQALLDDDRVFGLADGGAKKELAGVTCTSIKVIDKNRPDYIPFEACVHPTLDMPYDNTEVLYLLRIIGKHMADFLRENRETFKRVPMELHLDLAAGGRLDTKVVSVKQTSSDKLDLSARGSLGSPFDVPADYADPTVKKVVKPKPEKKESDN